MDLAAHWDGHLCGHDVVFRIRIVIHVQTVEVLGRFADEVGVNWTQLSVRPRVTEVKGKLRPLNLNRHGVRTGLDGSERCRPAFHSEDAQRQHFRSTRTAAAYH